MELAGAEGTMEVHEVGVGEPSPGGHAAETLGLTLEEGKATLAGLQRHLVRAGSVRVRANWPAWLPVHRW